MTIRVAMHLRRKPGGGKTVVPGYSRRGEPHRINPVPSIRRPEWVLPSEPLGIGDFDELPVSDEDIKHMTIEKVPTDVYWNTNNSAHSAFLAKDVYWEEPEDRNAIRSLARAMRAGHPVPPVGAVADVETGVIEEFDGGHRIRAAAIAGTRYIPIAVAWSRNGKIVPKPVSAPAIRWSP